MANNIDEFKEEVKSFIEKAKAAGKSNLAIQNTINFKYNEYLKDQTAAREQAEKDRTYGLEERKVALDEEKAKQSKEEWTATGTTDSQGNAILYNKYTGETKIAEPYQSSEDIYGEGDGTTGDQISDTQPTTPEPNMSTNAGAVYGPLASTTPTSTEVNPEQQKNLEYYGNRGLFRTMQEVIPQVAKTALKGIYEQQKGNIGKTKRFLFGTEPWIPEQERPISSINW